MKMRLSFTVLALGLVACLASLLGADSPAPAGAKSEAEWKKILTPEQFVVMVHEGTERPGSSALLHEKREGVFVCAAAPEQVLFRSADKFESGTGWPSF